jgi:hypothetical protein
LILIEPEVTYMLANDVHPYIRRVYTDGRDWPESFEPACTGDAGRRAVGARFHWPFQSG